MSLDLPPSVLDFNVEGFAHCTTRWADGHLVFYPQGWWVASVPPVRSQPTEDQWRSFRASITAMRVVAAAADSLDRSASSSMAACSSSFAGRTE